MARKIPTIVALGASALLAGAAQAQSSVTVYGLMDIGVSRWSNIGGESSERVDSGISIPSFLGVRGEEDLGGGTKAIFDLEHQFAVSTGGNIGNFFGRTSIVGLSSASLGTVKLGNQFDFMSESLTEADLVPAKFVGGLPNYPSGPTQFRLLNRAAFGPDAGNVSWDRTSQEAVNNSIKYKTPNIGGFSAGVMYGMDENKTSATGRVVSFGANYSNGPLALGLAFTGQKNLVGGDGVNPVNLRTYGLGANYKLNPMMLIGNFTRTSNSVNDAAAWQVSFGVFYPLDNAWSVGAMLTHEKGNDVLENAKANQFAAIVNYAFSKRTQVYLTGSVQKASSGANAQMTGTFADGDLPAAGASSGRSQSMVRVGMRHFF